LASRRSIQREVLMRQLDQPFCFPFGNRRLLHCLPADKLHQGGEGGDTRQPEGEVPAWESCGKVIRQERQEYQEFVVSWRAPPRLDLKSVDASRRRRELLRPLYAMDMNEEACWVILGARAFGREEENDTRPARSSLFLLISVSNPWQSAHVRLPTCSSSSSRWAYYGVAHPRWRPRSIASSPRGLVYQGAAGGRDDLSRGYVSSRRLPQWTQGPASITRGRSVQYIEDDLGLGAYA